MRSSRMWSVGLGRLYAVGELGGLAFSLIGLVWALGHMGIIPARLVEPIAGGVWLVAALLAAATFLLAVACLLTAAVEWTVAALYKRR